MRRLYKTEDSRYCLKWLPPLLRALIAVIGYLFGRPAFLDIAIVYALINFVTTIALMKFFRYRSLALPLTTGPAEDTDDA